MHIRNQKEFNPKSQIVSVIILIALLILTFVMVDSNMEDLSFQKLAGLLEYLHIEYILLSLLCLFGYIFFEGRAMAAASKPFGVQLGWLQSTKYAGIELYFSAITPSATGGQPALAYYMHKDGFKTSKSSAMLLVNTFHYTLSLVVMGVVVLAVQPSILFHNDNALFMVLLVIGFAAHVGLLVVCLLLMFSHKLVFVLGDWGIRLLCFLHVFKSHNKKIEAYRASLETYKACVQTAKKDPKMQAKVFLLNICQRLCVFSIAYFIYLCLGNGDGSYWNILSIQVLSAISVNALPLPGAVGAAEPVFLVLYAELYDPATLGPAMLFTRFFSSYLCFILCGIVAIVNHIVLMKKRGEIVDDRRL